MAPRSQIKSLRGERCHEQQPTARCRERVVGRRSPRRHRIGSQCDRSRSLAGTTAEMSRLVDPRIRGGRFPRAENGVSSVRVLVGVAQRAVVVFRSRSELSRNVEPRERDKTPLRLWHGLTADTNSYATRERVSGGRVVACPWLRTRLLVRVGSTTICSRSTCRSPPGCSPSSWSSCWPRCCATGVAGGRRGGRRATAWRSATPSARAHRVVRYRGDGIVVRSGTVGRQPLVVPSMRRSALPRLPRRDPRALVPEVRFKRDLIPGTVDHVTLTFTRAGRSWSRARGSSRPRL
jgi:hypothetical protein